MEFQDTDIKQLVTLVAHNDQRAFDTFYHLYYKQVFRTAYYYIKDVEMCREVVSNVFFSTWKSRKVLLEIQNINSYLFTVTKHEALHWLSQNETHSLSLSDLPLALEIQGNSSPEEELVENELIATLGRILQTLPERCRMIFMMSREEGIDNKAIASRLNISESTVRVQLKIAIDKIVEQLKHIYPHLTLSWTLFLLFRGY